MPQSLDTIVAKRMEFLTATRTPPTPTPTELVAQVRARESALGLGNKLSTAVAKYYFKLMAYKDEYEVARLYTDGRFVEQLQSQFEGNFSVKFNLAPPLFAKKDAKGHLVKAEFGSWMWSAFKLLAKLKGLRGGALDIFGYTEERKMERALIVEYREMVQRCWPAERGQPRHRSRPGQLPEKVRGFGHVKEKAVATFRTEKARLMASQQRAACNEDTFNN
jgi:indolepyruvate ferredoxin oxidoreductase